MDQKALETEITQFRDDLKKYQKIVRDIWSRKQNHSDWDEIKKLMKTEEAPLREKLVEDFGKIEKYFVKIGITMQGTIYGKVFPIFDSAFDEKLFENPIKGEALSMAFQMATKAVGIIKSFNEKETGRLEKETPIVFVSYNFNEKNQDITKIFKDFISKFDVAILEGLEVNTISISEKIKIKIDDADIVVAIMTKDEQDDKGVWSPSKWIIEELAYSLAKNKEIIRVLEKGCDTNGRIFGDKEYIPFDRENPTEAIIKLAEVLNKKIH